jgi:hypothetical protein
VAGGGILPLLRQRLASPQDIFYINTGTTRQTHHNHVLASLSP